MGKLASLLKLKPFIKKYMFYFEVGIIGMILSSAISILAPYMIGHLMDDILLNKKSYSKLYIYIAIIAGLYILTYLLLILSNCIFVKINNLVVNELRYAVMRKVMELPMDYLSNVDKGYVQSRISECSTIGNIFSPSVLSMFLNSISAVLALITMFSVNAKLTFVVFFLVPIFFFSSKISSKNFTEYTKQMLESNALLNGECFEIINGIEDIKILNGKETHLNKFKKKVDKLIEISMKQSKSMIIFVENIGISSKFGSLLILLVAGFLILKGEFTIGLYTSFSLYINRIFISSEGLANLETVVKPICLSIERIFELLDMKGENYERNAILKEHIESLAFENVSFKYNESKMVLNSLSFKISKGDKVLIKGENGSGKSTIIKLLLGLYKQSEGKILYNDINSNDIIIENIREKIGVVCQNIFLFKGTVIDNILYGQTSKQRKDVEEIIIKLNLQEYITKLPNGLDTEIIQNTTGVSGGQAQIIAFIRTMISEKDILIFDEPISNVDAETREIVLNILRRINFNGILIIISHLTEGMEFINKTIRI